MSMKGATSFGEGACVRERRRRARFAPAAGICRLPFRFQTDRVRVKCAAFPTATGRAPRGKCHVRQDAQRCRLRSRALGRDPGRGTAPGRAHRADRLRELHQPARAADAGHGAHQQVRRRLPAQALLRRLRIRGPRRGARHRAREAAVRRRLRQRAAALGLAGQQRRLPRAVPAGRRGARHEPGARRSPDPRRQAELLRQDLQRLPVRPGPGHGRSGLRRGRAPGAGAQAAHDRGGLLGLLAHHGLGAFPRHRRQGRRVPAGRHGARRGPGRRGSLPEPGAARRRGHHHHAQDAARPARRPDHRAQERRDRPRS